MFVDYQFVNSDVLPSMGNKLYQYLVASNGVFVRAWRPGMDALIPVSGLAQPVRGLRPLKPYLRIEKMVPAVMVARMFEKAYRAGRKEILFYLRRSDIWTLQVPDQNQSGAAVSPVDPFSGGDVILEVHSHHYMRTFFSKTDDQEEQAGFRLYSVIGDFGRQPSILTRVGIYGHFYNIPSRWVYEFPRGLVDGLEKDHA